MVETGNYRQFSNSEIQKTANNSAVKVKIKNIWNIQKNGVGEIPFKPAPFNRLNKSRNSQPVIIAIAGIRSLLSSIRSMRMSSMLAENHGYFLVKS